MDKPTKAERQFNAATEAVRMYKKQLIKVTEQNVLWAIEVSGRSEEYILEALQEATESGLVCVVEVIPMSFGENRV